MKFKKGDKVKSKLSGQISTVTSSEQRIDKYGRTWFMVQEVGSEISYERLSSEYKKFSNSKSIAQIVTSGLLNHLHNKGNLFSIPNFYLGDFECDVFSALRSLYTIEYEIKTSKSDFENDFKKQKDGANKHELIKSGKRTNRFYFVVPKDLIPPKDTYYGLIYYEILDEENGIDFEIINKAPILHRKEADISKGLSMNLINSYYARWYKYFYCERWHKYFKEEE